MEDRWVRANEKVKIWLGNKADVNKKMFLRLTRHSENSSENGQENSSGKVYYLPLNNEQMKAGVIEVQMPGPDGLGHAKTEIVSEGGEVLAHGPDIKVAASEKPFITKVTPEASYPSNGRYSFSITGEHFGTDKDSVNVLINDEKIDFKSRRADREEHGSLPTDSAQLPSLLWNWRTLRVIGYSIDSKSLHRPFHVNVEVDKLVSEGEQQLLLPWIGRYIPRLLALTALGILLVAVRYLCREKAKQYQVKDRTYGAFAYLLIDSETNTYSLSHLQLAIWTGAAVTAYVYLASCQSLVQWKWVLPRVPDNLPTLLGISAGTTALSIGVAGVRGSKGAGPVHPELGDLITSGGVFAPERLQFLVWTLLGAFGFVCSTLAQEPATVTDLPQVPESFIPLMGLSSLGYLAGKFARKPGPVIKQIVGPPPGADPREKLYIMGENFSSRTRVFWNGKELKPEEIFAPDQPLPGSEFVTKLVIKSDSAVERVSGFAQIKVINLDGQSAEM
jgi:hypothetical protein